MQQLVYGERVARTVRLQRAAAEKAAAEACSERLAAGGASTQGALCPTSPAKYAGALRACRVHVSAGLLEGVRTTCVPTARERGLESSCSECVQLAGHLPSQVVQRGCPREVN